jgi:peptidase M1-like protein
MGKTFCLLFRRPTPAIHGLLLLLTCNLHLAAQSPITAQSQPRGQEQTPAQSPIAAQSQPTTREPTSAPSQPITPGQLPATTQSPPRDAPAYWQQEVHYDISVTLNDVDHTLKGNETIVYINHSPDTLSFIYFHLWPNAYKDNTTGLYKQLSRIEERKGKLNKIKENGYIDQLAFTVNGVKAVTQPDPQYIDIVRLLLPDNIPPGGQISIATPFLVKIPSYFSRLGHEGQSYMITQWYPKPAVYDRTGWHEMPYLDQGEFYSEFGSFDVHITLPAPYVVGATGILQDPEELSLYKSIGMRNRRADTISLAGTIPYRAKDPQTLKTLDYHADDVHDFAWFADKNLTIDYDTLQLGSGRVIDVFSYYRPATARLWKHSISFIKDAVLHYSKWVGEYPYPVVSAVEGPGNISSGGMEYPTITLITSPGADKTELDGVIAHEVGHNWFYAALGSNERDHPWMDEGINTFYEFRYEAEKYRANTLLGSMIPSEVRKLPLDKFEDAIYSAFNQLKTVEPIETPATRFTSEYEYDIVVYAKSAAWMYGLQKTIGLDNFEKGMQNYFSNWKFKHPYPEDLKTSLEQITHSNLDASFDQLNKSGSF